MSDCPDGPTVRDNPGSWGDDVTIFPASADRSEGYSKDLDLRNTKQGSETLFNGKIRRGKTKTQNRRTPFDFLIVHYIVVGRV